MNIPGLKQLVTPLNYLRIKRKTIKMWYDWYLPAIATMLILSLIIMSGFDLNIFGNGGLIQQVTELLKMLIGFYIAALAAVATFPSAVLDQKLDGEFPTTLNTTRRGVNITIPLSRRRFLSYLFGYLSFMSMAMFITGTIVVMIAPHFVVILDPNIKAFISYLGLTCFLFWLFNMLIATLLGLHYLTDRIHRPVDGNIKATENE